MKRADTFLLVLQAARSLEAVLRQQLQPVLCGQDTAELYEAAVCQSLERVSLVEWAHPSELLLSLEQLKQYQSEQHQHGYSLYYPLLPSTPFSAVPSQPGIALLRHMSLCSLTCRSAPSLVAPECRGCS